MTVALALEMALAAAVLSVSVWTIAARDTEIAEAVANAIGGRTFRPYASDDPVGVEIGGAVKNVIAIACGIVLGRGLGENARDRRLADTARAREQVGVMQPARGQRVRERTDDVRLAHERFEAPGPPFDCEDRIAHAAIPGRNRESASARPRHPT